MWQHARFADWVVVHFQVFCSHPLRVVYLTLKRVAEHILFGIRCIHDTNTARLSLLFYSRCIYDYSCGSSVSLILDASRIINKQHVAHLFRRRLTSSRRTSAPPERLRKRRLPERRATLSRPRLRWPRSPRARLRSISLRPRPASAAVRAPRAPTNREARSHCLL